MFFVRFGAQGRGLAWAGGVVMGGAAGTDREGERMSIGEVGGGLGGCRKDPSKRRLAEV